ncbi:MAG: ABC transporter permease [Alphaproteobacteria bacterium]|nr:ABC transporter permease [Alphaproteobacteria bacterium]
MTGGTWPLAWRLARRELRGGLRGFRVFLACLALGVAAIAGVGSLASSVTKALRDDARLLLDGDVELSFTHREASAEQLRHLTGSGRVSVVAEMRAMASGGDSRVLVELKAVDIPYPLVGRARTTPEMPLRDALAERDGEWGALAERATLARLGLKPGDTLRLGDRAFRVRGVLDAEPDRSANVFTLGPRVMIAVESLAGTGLVQPGSLIRWQYRVALPAGADAEAFIEDLKQRFPQAGWRIRSLSEAAPGLQRWVDRIAMFLTLVGLTALLVGGVGVANAVRSFIDGKTATIATLKCIGAPNGLVLRVYLAQVMAMAAIGIAVGLVVGGIVPVAVAPLIAQAMGVQIRTGVFAMPLALGTVYGLLVAFAFAFWPVAQARDVPAGALFRALVAPPRAWPRRDVLLATIAAILALSALAIVTALDPRLGAGFVAGAAATFLLFRLAASLIRRVARNAPTPRSPMLRLALANLHRPGGNLNGIVLSLGLGLTVLTIISLVHGNFARALKTQLPDIAPSFFFIDIQPDQLPVFDAIVAGAPGVAAVQRVPSLRGRITALNGVPVDKVAVSPDAQWAIGSDRGLTYSGTLPRDARVVAGAWWPADYRGPPLVSFDAQIARGMGLKLGDTITLNVLGREIVARIANLRAIDWSTLGINFTLIFAPGTLEGAPQTWIATAQVDREHEDALERAIGARLPNVSSIRVREALATVEGVLGSIARAAQLTASVTLLAGALTLAGAVAATQRRRIYDAVVLKVLGARRIDVLAALVVEFGVIGLAVALIATFVGSIAAWLLVTHYMRVDFTWLPLTAAGVVGAAMAAVIAIGLAGTWRALGQKPAPLLRNA